MLATSTKKKLLQTPIALQQNELDKHFEHLAQGQIVRSRAKLAELGEKKYQILFEFRKTSRHKESSF